MINIFKPYGEQVENNRVLNNVLETFDLVIKCVENQHGLNKCESINNILNEVLYSKIGFICI